MKGTEVFSIYSSLDLRLTEDEKRGLVDHLDLLYNCCETTAEDVYARFNTLRDALNKLYASYCACYQVFMLTAVLIPSHLDEFYYDGAIINGAPLFLLNLREN